MVIPSYSINEKQDPSIEIVKGANIYLTTTGLEAGVEYDISRVSTRNARKSQLGPYKNSYLREIIASHKMGKTSGTKEQLVETILNFHEKKTN